MSQPQLFKVLVKLEQRLSLNTMSTTKTTSQSNTYAPGSMATYQNLTGSGGQVLSQNASQPFSNPFFQSSLNATGQANTNLFNNSNTALAQRSNALGIPSNSPFMASQLGANQRQLMTNQSNSFNNLYAGAIANRNNSVGSMMQYRPLQTGGSQVQATGGPGTMLPLVDASIAAGSQVAASALAGGNQVPPQNPTGDQQIQQDLGQSVGAQYQMQNPQQQLPNGQYPAYPGNQQLSYTMGSQVSNPFMPQGSGY